MDDDDFALWFVFSSLLIFVSIYYYCRQQQQQQKRTCRSMIDACLLRYFASSHTRQHCNDRSLNICLSAGMIFYFLLLFNFISCEEVITIILCRYLQLSSKGHE
jgi:F0F1-type ATP synthase membrane subunit a